MRLSNTKPMDRDELISIAESILEGLGGKILHVEFMGVDVYVHADGTASEYIEWTVHLDCPGFCAKDVVQESYFTLVD